MRVRVATARDLLSVGVLAAVAAIFRPMVMLATNNWDLASFDPLILYAFAVFAVQILAVGIAFLTGYRIVPVAVAISASTIVLMEWHNLSPGHPVMWLTAALGLGFVSSRLGPDALRGLIAVYVAVLVVGPTAQTATAFVNESQPYPTFEMGGEPGASATGLVEDVLIVVVDSYPSLALAGDWFGYDATNLHSSLTTNGFEVVESGWSHHSFTVLSVPSLLELRSVIDDRPTGHWGNRRNLFQAMRGNNLVAKMLQSAGYSYTHVESGLDSGTCGRGVDLCLQTGLFNEVSLKLLQPSWFEISSGGPWLENTLTAASHLMSLEPKFGDGKRDYVFAHLFLPHPPHMADSNCDPVPPSRSMPLHAVTGDDAQPSRFLGQFSCVDRLLAEISSLAGPRTAVLITGDHGSDSQGQLSEASHMWSDSEIAERLSILLAYKIPDECPSVLTDSNIEALREIVSCAVVADLPTFDSQHMIGWSDPVRVDPARMDAIKDQVASGELRPGN